MSDEAQGSLPPVAYVFRHHALLIIATMTIFAAGAWWYSSGVQHTYTADSMILLSPAVGNPLTPETASQSSLQLTTALETEAQLVRTPAVAAAAGDVAGRYLPEEWEKLTASVPSNTQMLLLSFTSTSPEAAREGADAFAEGYLAYRQERAATQQAARVEKLTEQVEEVKEALQRVTPDDAEAAARLSPEAQLFTEQLAGLTSSLGQATAMSTFPGTIVNSADLPTDPNEIAANVLIAAAAVVGMALGIGLGFTREWHRDLIRGEADLPELPIFATVRLGETPSLAPDSDPRVHESYRHVRIGVLANCPAPHILAVAGLSAPDAPPQSGESAVVATNLAVVLAEAGFAVLLVATAEQAGEVRALLRPQPGSGIYSGDPATASEEAVSTQGIRLLTLSGNGLHSPDITASREFSRLLHAALPGVDYVIVAAAEAGTADGDATLVAAHSSLLLLRPNRISRRDARTALTRLQRLGARIVGGVLYVRGTTWAQRSPVVATRQEQDHARS